MHPEQTRQHLGLVARKVNRTLVRPHQRLSAPNARSKPPTMRTFTRRWDQFPTAVRTDLGQREWFPTPMRNSIGWRDRTPTHVCTCT